MSTFLSQKTPSLSVLCTFFFNGLQLKQSSDPSLKFHKNRRRSRKPTTISLQMFKEGTRVINPSQQCICRHMSTHLTTTDFGVSTLHVCISINARNLACCRSVLHEIPKKENPTPIPLPFYFSSPFLLPSESSLHYRLRS